MTTTEASALAIHATQPELAPVCDKCHQPQTQQRNGYNGKSWVCKPCRYGQRLHKDAPPCDTCGTTMRLYNRKATRQAPYWSCPVCHLKRKKELQAERDQEAADAVLASRDPCWRERRDYWGAWRNIQRLPRVGVEA